MEIATDSRGAKSFASPRGSGRIRHIEVKWLWLEQAVADGRFRMTKVAGAKNPPDVLTKHKGVRDLQEQPTRALIKEEVPVVSLFDTLLGKSLRGQCMNQSQAQMRYPGLGRHVHCCRPFVTTKRRATHSIVFGIRRHGLRSDLYRNAMRAQECHLNNQKASSECPLRRQTNVMLGTSLHKPLNCWHRQVAVAGGS